MKLQNKTPFVPFAFQSTDLSGEPFQVILAKGTFDLVPGEGLRLAAQQAPVCTGDEYHATSGGAAPSSLRQEDDLAPFKPRSDILVTATAHAPGRAPSREWLAGVTVGRVHKRVLVTGPRAWVHTPLMGWTLGDPEPALSVPLRYERAYGGPGYPENPAGTGFVDHRSIDRAEPIRAPSILSPDFRTPALGERYPVEGLAAIAKPWLQRRSRAGTFDEAWEKERKPKLPSDFDFTFYNAAHPDLVYDGYLQGLEEVRLERLHPDHEILRFSLPGYTLGAAITDKAGYRYGGAARLDTLHIDAMEMKIHLVYRATLPLFKDKIARIDIAMRESLGAVMARAERKAT